MKEKILQEQSKESFQWGRDYDAIQGAQTATGHR